MRPELTVPFIAEAGARAWLHQGAAVGAGGPAAAARVLADYGAAARPRAGENLPGKCQNYIQDVQNMRQEIEEEVEW